MAEKEYISREEAIEWLYDNSNLPIDSGTARAYWTRVVQIKDALIRHIKTIPAADVVELPLNIGDVVYASRRWEENGAFLPYQITCLTITQNKKKEWRKNYRAFRLINGKTIDSYVSFSFDEIGKKVFLTIEEAERYAKMDGERKEETP